ncbi:MAG: respiratory nitrate reductase subunit gamma, partial [Candidatus Thermoplasmatota archaeon]|nr:respiratory nitrate reductase subunit gamma [Candidatus Thermoplasmatota archaeon]
MIEEFMFGVLPYLALGLFFAVTFFRAFSGGLRWSARGDYQWTSMASGFFGKRKMGLSSVALHWGIFILLFSHILGLIGS